MRNGRLFSKVVGVIALLAVIATAPLVSFAQEPQAGEGTAETGIQLQNVGEGDTTAQVTLYGQNTGSEVVLADRNIAQEAAINYYMPQVTDAQGNALDADSYSLVATADQPLQAIVNTSYENLAASIYGSAVPGNHVIVPIFFEDWGGQTSNITVQNASTDADASYTVTIIGRQNRGSDTTGQSGTLQPGRSVTFTANDFNISGNTDDLIEGSEGFIGYADIVSEGAPVVAQSFIDVAGAAAVAGFSGISADSADSTLYAPLIRSNFAGDTGIQLVNVSDTDTTVTVTFYTDMTTMNSVQPDNDLQATYEQTLDLPAGDSVVSYQGFADPDKPMPDGNRTNAAPSQNGADLGWLGVAQITTDPPVNLIGVVQDNQFDASYVNQNQGNYNLATAAGGGTRFASPLVRSNYLPQNRLTTGVQIQNLTGNEATVNIEYTITRIQSDGTEVETLTESPAAVTVPANATANIYQGAQQDLFPSVITDLDGAGWFGSAVITSDQNIIALVNDETNVFANPTAGAFDRANFNAIKLN